MRGKNRPIPSQEQGLRLPFDRGRILWILLGTTGTRVAGLGVRRSDNSDLNGYKTAVWGCNGSFTALPVTHSHRNVHVALRLSGASHEVFRC